MDDGDRGFDDGYDGSRPAAEDAANPIYAVGYREGYNAAKEESNEEGILVPRWVVKNYDIVRKAQGWTNDDRQRVRQETADDAEWRREQAMEAGMAFGCGAFNEIMNWD